MISDETFLAQKAEPATTEDLSVAQDLLDILTAHKDGCVGMAANMIGVNKRVIVFDKEGDYMVMFNPEIVKKSGPYHAEESCLSLSGVRKAKRWKSIKVQSHQSKYILMVGSCKNWQKRFIAELGLDTKIAGH